MDDVAQEWSDFFCPEVAEEYDIENLSIPNLDSTLNEIEPDTELVNIPAEHRKRDYISPMRILKENKAAI